MNTYCKEIINYTNKNYKNIVNIDDFVSISVGGSVARGHALSESDIDLICLSNKYDQYRKVFRNIDNMKFEIHIIPINYIYTLINKISKYIIFSNNISAVETPNVVSMGAKKCNIISRKEDEFTSLLSAWRELKKIVDSIIVYEDNSRFLTNIKQEFEKIEISPKIFNLFEENMSNYSNVDFLINSLKLYSLLQYDVFSKVLWTDMYFKEKYNSQMKELVKKIFDNMKVNTDDFSIWKNEKFKYLIEIHSKMDCSFCKDDYLQCNIMRCIVDYLNDIEKAKNAQMQYGEILSIKKCLEYIEALFKKANIEDNELKIISKEFEINKNDVLNVYQYIKKEYEKSEY